MAKVSDANFLASETKVNLVRKSLGVALSRMTSVIGLLDVRIFNSARPACIT